MTTPPETYPSPHPGHNIHQDRPETTAATPYAPVPPPPSSGPSGASLHTETPDPPAR